MDETFSKLRFGQFTKAAAAGVIAGAIALQPTAGLAATGSVTITTSNPAGVKVKWFVNTNITFSTTSNASLAMSEASMHTAAAATASSFNRTDAFDGVLAWHVYSTPPGGSDQSGGYFKSELAATATANSVTGPNLPLAGLTAHTELYFPTGANVVRSILYLQNPTGSPITVTVDNDNNLGSDAGTLIRATSSGDAVFDSADNWVVSCQSSDTPGSCDQNTPPSMDSTKDPVITFAFQGPGGIRATNAGAIFANGNDNPNFRWSGITVPAGGTRGVMVFVQLSDTDTNAEAAAVKFNSNSTLQATDYLAGLSGAQQAEIVNWTLNPNRQAPTLGEWALIAFGGLLGLFGLERAGFLIRRRRTA
jgi:hypothetical protein